VPLARVVVRDADLFARRRHRLLAGLALPPRLAFLPYEAIVAGHLRWAVGVRLVPRVAQDLCATIWQPVSRLRKVSRLLEQRGSPISSPAKEPVSLMVGFAWSYSVALRSLKHGCSIWSYHLSPRDRALSSRPYGIVSGRSLRAKIRARARSMTSRPGYWVTRPR